MGKEQGKAMQEHGNRMAHCLSATLCWYSVSWSDYRRTAYG
jgi:hypothetical protein